MELRHKPPSFKREYLTTNPLTGLLLPEIIIQQRYRILDVLGTGTVSTVYKAEGIQLGNRVVTLKEIGKNNQNTQEALASIEASKREMLLLASLIHPNLPRIYDYFVENHRWYFVMDFLAGETLEAYLSKRKYRPLPVEEVLDSGIQLTAVLDYRTFTSRLLTPMISPCAISGARQTANSTC
jgi:serine/threonine protein kinase